MFNDIIKKPNPVVMIITCPYCGSPMLKCEQLNIFECRNPNCQASVDDTEEEV